MALFDLLGRSWALGIVWQLSEGPLTFRQLQDRCGGVSPTVLNTRIKELSAGELVERGESGYQLTKTGFELFEMIRPLGGWSKDWSERLEKARKP